MRRIMLGLSQRCSAMALAAVAAQTACTQGETPPSPPAAATAATAATTARPVLVSTVPIVPLAVPRFSDAVVSVPLGATSPRPVVVATHGLWDFPEGLCDNWRWIVGDRAWVLCPRGHLRPDKTYRYESGPALAAEIDAGVRALGERYPGFVDDGPMLYTGFSLGAILGVWIISHDPARYPRAVLTEGGEDRWLPDVADRFVRGGGKRVLFACGLKVRVDAARRAGSVIERAGAQAHVVFGALPDAGQFIHWYNGPVADETKAQLEWLFEGDARW